MRKENGVYTIETITDAYLLGCMTDLNDWCKKNNPTINEFQDKVIDIVFRIEFYDNTHPLLLLKEHPEWTQQTSFGPGNSIERLILSHLATYVKQFLFSNVFRDGLPYMKGEE